MTATSSSGNSAVARYSGALAEPRVSVYAYAVNAPDGMGGWDPSGASAQVTARDRLVLTVPAGTYPEGVDVTLNGFLDLVLTATGRGQALGGFLASMGGGASFSTGNLEAQGLGGTDVVTRILPFSLTRQLVSPGATLSSPSDVPVDLIFEFRNSVAGTQSSPPEPISASGEVDGQAYCTSIVAPAAVTWVSDSGVFSCAPEVPLSPLAAAAIASLLGLCAWLSLRRLPIASSHPG